MLLVQRERFRVLRWPITIVESLFFSPMLIIKFKPFPEIPFLCGIREMLN